MRALAVGLAELVRYNQAWMAWNLFLALVPWALAVLLFRPQRRTTPVWVVGTAICLLALPNAAYVLTDVIHVPRQVRNQPDDVLVLFGVFPLFAAFFTVGFAAYCDAVRRMCRFAADRGWVRHPWVGALAVHAVSTVGIYAGRIHRFNSWDALTRPALVLDRTLGGFTRPLPVAGMVFTFAVLALGYLVAVRLLEGRVR